MAYIGRQNLGGAYRQLDDISSGFDGSDTTHTMQVNSQNVTVGDVNQIILSLGGVIQKPGTDFTVSGSVLTFTTAPAANTSFFAILLGSDNGGTVTPTDGSVTGDKVASTGAFTIGAAGTTSSIAGANILVESNSLFIGDDVSGTTDTAANSVAVGIDALDAVTTGDANVAIGKSALTALNSGANNIAIGNQAGAAITTGGSNIAIGSNALDAEDTGTQSIAIGPSALTTQNNDTDSNNICIGYEAGESITTGRWNHFIGSYAGDDFDTEHSNLGIGYRALGGSIAGGEYNSAIGNTSGFAVTSGDANTFYGYYAGADYTTGGENTAIGAESAMNSTTGNGNTTLGFRAIYENTATGSENTCLGAFAGYRLTSGGLNTIIGYDCATLITSGSNNIMIGVDAGVTGSPGGAIGTGSNNVGFGDENISSCHIQTDWTVASDQRDKTDFTALDLGLDFVNDLKPYTFKWDKRIKYVSKEDRNTVDLDTVTSDGTHKEDWLDLGFKAQDVEALEKTAGYKIADKTNLTTSLTEDGKQYGIKYSNFVPILVKAIQELSAKVKALEEA